MAVQPEQFAEYEELCRKIEAGTAAGRYIVAIDGRCGAGKSTLAQQLARDLGGRVVCADDASGTAHTGASGRAGRKSGPGTHEVGSDRPAECGCAQLYAV